MNVPGYITAAEARLQGFTHHGSYYGIPLWITDDDECPMVATKHAALEPLLSLFTEVEQLVLFLCGADPSFMFIIREPIDG